MTFLPSRFFRKLRSVLFFTTLVSFIGITISLLWLNAIGMPQSWRTALENKIAEKGYHVRIGHLSYIPWIGVKMQNIHVFTSSDRTEEMANLKQLIFDFDKTKAMRGIQQLTKIELGNTDLLIPTISPEGKNGNLTITDLSGAVLFHRNQKVKISRVEGYIAGVKIVLNADILSWGKSKADQDSDKNDFTYKEYLHQFVREISLWEWDLASPPELQLDLAADLTKWSDLQAKLTFSSKSLKRGGMELKDVALNGSIKQWQLTLQECSASDSHGHVHASLNLDLHKLQGNFLATSSANLLALARGFSSRPVVPEIAAITEPQLEVEGFFDLNHEKSQFQATGKTTCKTLQFRNHIFDHLQFDFSLNNQDFFLRDLELHHAQGNLNLSLMKKGHTLQARSQGYIPLDVLRPLFNHKVISPALENLVVTGLSKCHATLVARADLENGFALESLTVSDLEVNHKQGWLKGSAQLKGKDVSYQIESNFPPALGKPFFVGQPLEKVLDAFSPAGADETYVSLKGTADTTDIYKWHVEGKASVKNTAYRGVPVYGAACSMDLSSGFLKFTDIEVNFNYEDYPLRKEFSAVKNGPVKAAHVHWISEHGHVEIHKLNGTLFPAPLLRMFAPSIAENLEDYRFHAPPQLSASGIIDVRKAKNTKVIIDMPRCDAMTWKFIGQPTVFSEISTQVIVNDDQVTLNPLRCKLFGGDVSGNIAVQIRKNNAYSVDATWQGMLMEEIAKTHQFKEQGYGKLTGKISLKGDNRGTVSLEGDGLCNLEKGELFAVPLFGPLSDLVSGMVDDKKRIGFEKAKDAFANFTITQGIMETSDFVTQTSNLKFTGNGKVDLGNQTIDMTMRMNARGIIGFITWPLSPIIKGLFQFHGTGSIAKPTWNHVVFTSPAEKEKKALLEVNPR